jgi:hypothetical protein
MKQTSTSKNLSVNRSKNQEKLNNSAYLPELEPRLQYCLRNLRIACKAVQVAIPLGELKLKEKKIEATLKNLFTIYDPCTHQGLSNHSTLSTILSGATVPLSYRHSRLL